MTSKSLGRCVSKSLPKMPSGHCALALENGPMQLSVVHGLETLKQRTTAETFYRSPASTVEDGK